MRARVQQQPLLACPYAHCVYYLQGFFCGQGLLTFRWEFFIIACKARVKTLYFRISLSVQCNSKPQLEFLCEPNSCTAVIRHPSYTPRVWSCNSDAFRLACCAFTEAHFLFFSSPPC